MKPTRQHRTLQNLLVIALMFLATGARADLAGTWKGQVDTATRPVAVTLTITQASSLGQPAGTLEYGQPWTCRLDLEYSGDGRDANSKIFSLSIPLIGPAPGPCKVLIGGNLSVSSKQNDILEMTAVTKQHKTRDKVSLQRDE